ncbi:hypothetical protein Acr_06g0004740 [Actinidia rufa]|uniref:Uncharacterized protein n=1 Tax=Actinidia rufa TaxID=165716 RepID=A0A7J0EPY3_9ERIC|nr:hypothetical protein Acr_06g0004740 [Actinidia rufa]
MDSKSNLCLGLISHSTIPLQLMEQQSENHKGDESDNEESESGGEESESESEIKEFRILGHSMCLKRKRDGESVSSLKRGSVEPQGLESRRNGGGDGSSGEPFDE